MKQITGVVQNTTTKSGNSKTLGPMNYHSITIATATGNVVVQKATKPSTAFNIVPGTNVQVTYEETVQGNFTNNKIVQNGLIILAGESTQATPVQAPTQTTSFTASPVKKEEKGRDAYNEGARNGMITGKAVELAIARKAFTIEGLKKAADDIKALTIYVETGKSVESSGISAAVAKAVTETGFEEESENPFE